MYLRLMITLIGILCVGTLLSTAVAAQTPAEPTNYQVYSVINGDTITSVADAMKITEAALISFNQLTAGAALTPGDLLIIPNDVQYAAKPKPAVGPAASNVVYESGIAIKPGMPRYATADVATTPTLKRNLDELIPEISKVPASGTISSLKGICSNEISLVYNEPECTTVIWDKNTRGKAVSVFGKQGTSYAVVMADGSTAWMRKSDLQITDNKLSFTRVAPPIPPPAQQVSVNAAAIIATAKGYLGKPYVYGGNGVTNIDCSLLIQQAFAEHGIKLPRTAHEQAEIGTYVAPENLQPGDRLYFNHYYGGAITHTGIYIGDDKVLHASSSAGKVTISDISVFKSGNTIYAWAKR